MGRIDINRAVSIDDSELQWRFARSGGPGGQHVNTSSTKVELRWNVERSDALSEAQKALLRQRLGSRITDDGVLVLQSSEHRSQTRNREAALARFTALVADALRIGKPRRATTPSAGARQRRLDAKRRNAEIKALRKPPAV